MKNRYEQILEQEGVEAAHEYMRQISLKRTKPSRKPGKVASEISKKGWITRNARKQASEGKDWPKSSDFAQS